MTADRSLLHLLHRGGQAADRAFEQLWKTEITTRQLMVLQILDVTPRASQTDLVRLSGIDRATMTGIIRRLRRQGLVLRRRMPGDARVYQVTITDKGAAALRAASVAHELAQRHILSVLTPEQQRALFDGLSRIVAGKRLRD